MIESGTLSYRTQVFFDGTLSSNLVISSLNFTNPVIFPINFIQSEAYSNTNAVISIAVNGTNVGYLTFFSAGFGAFQSLQDINVNIGDIMTFTVISGSGAAYVSITLNGTVYIAPIVYTFLPNVFSYNPSAFVVAGNVYPPNTSLCLGFSSNNIDPPTSYMTATTSGENWTATLSGGSFTAGIETYIWAEFISDESIYKICPFSPQSLSIKLTGIYDGTYTSGFISSANQNDTITITGNVITAGNAVQVALSTTNTLLPTSGYISATVTGSSWTANLTLANIGTYYVWAEQTNHTSIHVVSSPITVSTTSVSYGISNVTIYDGSSFGYKNYGVEINAYPYENLGSGNVYSSQQLEYAYSTTSNPSNVFTSYIAIPFSYTNFFSNVSYDLGIIQIPNSLSPFYVITRFVSFPSIYVSTLVSPINDTSNPVFQITSSSGPTPIYLYGDPPYFQAIAANQTQYYAFPKLIQNLYTAGITGTYTLVGLGPNSFATTTIPATLTQTEDYLTIIDAENTNYSYLDTGTYSISYADSAGNSVTFTDFVAS